jgi:hypothetical protein
MLHATVTLGDWCLVTQDSNVFFSSKVEKSTRNDMDIVSLKDKTTMLSQNIWHPSLSDRLPHPTRTEASAAPM